MRVASRRTFFRRVPSAIRHGSVARTRTSSRRFFSARFTPANQTFTPGALVSVPPPGDCAVQSDGAPSWIR